MDFQNFKKDLTELISIKSVQGTPTSNSPFGDEVRLSLEWFLQKGKTFGFDTINYDNYAGEITYGCGEDFAILVHLDVVPPSGKWDFDPFVLTEKDGKLIGRGVLDDKGPALLMLYVLKSLKDSGFSPNKKIRLIAGCNEESGWGCIDHLRKLGVMPKVGFSPDSDFPVIFAEKGIMHVEFQFECDSRLENIRGGSAVNMVCDYVNFTCPIDENLAKKFDIKINGNALESFGVTAHGSSPSRGINAIKNTLDYLSSLGIISSEIKKLLFGNQTGILDHFDDSGYLTFSPNIISKNDNHLSIICDIRYPSKMNYEIVLKELEKIGKYSILGHQNPLYVEKQGDFVQTLLEIYNSETGENAQPLAIGGGTYSRALELGIGFGPVFREEDAVCHQANEYYKCKDFEKAFEIYKKAIEKLCR